jgi:Tfp pilus assembly protein PilF
MNTPPSHSIAPVQTHEASLAQAFAMLQQNRTADAERACMEVLAKNSRHPGATHLLGLIRKAEGAMPEAERMLRESIALAPGHSEFRTNFGNFLRGLGRLDEAADVYRAALSIEPAHAPARLGLVRTLNDLSQHAAAESECRPLIAARGSDAQAWAALAMTLRDQRRLPEAEAAYRRSLELQPDYAASHHNLASVLIGQDRAAEALVSLQRAEALGLAGAEPAFNRGRALLQLYRLDEAEEAFQGATRIDPGNTDAQLALARLRYMRGDPRFVIDLASSTAARPSDVKLHLLLADVHRRTGDLSAAESVLRDLIDRTGAAPEIRSSLASVLHEMGRLRDAETEALQAAEQRPQDAVIVENLVSILLTRGLPADALPFIEAQRARRPSDQRWLAYEATAARLAGHPRYEELYDYQRFVRVYDLEAPAGWTSMQELNRALVETLTPCHRFATHPFDQSLRHGSQTAHNLLHDQSPAVRGVIGVFHQAVREYRASLGMEEAHPFTSRNRGDMSFAGAWSVQLHRDGFHVNHIHPEGWLSSAYYVAVPSESHDPAERSGWLKFGEPRFPAPGATPALVVQPRPGRLVLFPSYMWHGTTPIRGDEPRVSIAFDISAR